MDGCQDGAGYSLAAKDKEASIHRCVLAPQMSASQFLTSV